MAETSKRGRGAAPSKALAAAVSLPLLLSSIHALTQPEKHAGPLEELLADALKAVPNDAPWTRKLEAFAETHAEVIARLAGATLGAVSLQAVLSSDRRLPLSVLTMAAPFLTLANYPLTQVRRSGDRREETLRGWVSLAPALAALIMVSREETRKMRSLHAKTVFA